MILQDQQQQPGYRLDEVEAESVPAVLSLIDAIEQADADARALFFMVWARREGDTTNCGYYPLACSFETSTRAVQQGYELYAERAGVDAIPVALAWADVRADAEAKVPANTLWNSDAYHPALPGTYLAAAVFVRSMFGVDTAPLSYTASLDAEAARYLREVADRSVQAYDADPRVVTAERVSLACAFGAACSAAADAAPTTFTLSSNSCAALTSGSAQVAGRLRTTLSCRNSICTTVPLGSFRSVPEQALADGTYQVMVHVDVDEDGELSAGDLHACEEAGLVIGSGEDLSVEALELR